MRGGRPHGPYLRFLFSVSVCEGARARARARHLRSRPTASATARAGPSPLPPPPSPPPKSRYEAVFGRGYVSTGGEATTRALLPLLGLRLGQRVLDLGCGIGGGGLGGCLFFWGACLLLGGFVVSGAGSLPNQNPPQLRNSPSKTLPS